jgi:hypothetical protein
MTRVFQANELIVKTSNEVGTLARVTSPVAEARVNLNACWAWTEKKDGYFHLITSDNEEANRALSKAGFKTTQKSVVVVETTNEIGSLAKAASQLANASINVDYCYATAGNEGKTWIVFGTSAIEKALNAIS